MTYTELLKRIDEKKRKLQSFRPLDRHQLMLLKREMEIEYVYNSTSIEGNSLTLNETRLVLEEGITIKGKPLREHFDVINQKEAMEKLEEWINEKRKRITEEDILELHRITLNGISKEWAGRYKTVQNRVLGSSVKRTPPYLVREEMKKLVEFINSRGKLHPVELAAFAHQKLALIHPFLDGNGRCSRLLSNLILMREGYPPNTILNKERKKYFETIEKAHLGNMEPFMKFFARSLERMLDLYLNALTPTDRNNELLPISILAGETPYSQEYLSLQARRGRLSAVKIDGIWHSSREKIRKYMESVKK